MAEPQGSAEEIEQRVRRVIGEYFQIPPESVAPDNHLVDDLGADSLDLTELAVALEDAFEVEIPDAEFQQMMTVSGIISTLSTKLSPGR